MAAKHSAKALPVSLPPSPGTAANQTRLRASAPSWPFPENQTASPHTLQYSLLDNEKEEFRLLILHPKRTGAIDETIHCSLSHATFAQRQTYEALSYAWGDHSIMYDRPIKVNGVAVVVGYNLGCALEQLSRVGNNRNLWVDAICINQQDHEEKSSQIPLMPHIYARAQNCLVWLMEERDHVDSQVDERFWLENFTNSSTMSPRLSELYESRDNNRLISSFLERLVTNSYWQRVWIIQEIGSARGIKVLYCNFETDWPKFISRLREYSHLSEYIPLKLQAQIDDKYSDGHSLQHLIESHQDSLCHEPRDHIYGFTGLANDGHGFPIDYSKSIYEVWRDTLLFTTESSKTSKEDIVRYARVIKRILGEPVDQFENNVSVAKDAAQRHLLVQNAHDGHHKISVSSLLGIPGHVLVNTRIVGRIIHLGPAWSHFIAFPRKTADWKLSINKHFRAESRPMARECSDFFLRKLERFSEADVKFIMNYRNSTVYDFPEFLDIAKEPENSTQLSWEAADAEIKNKGFTSTSDVNDSAPRVFLMDTFETRLISKFNKKKKKKNPSTLAGCVGLAPSDAVQGDYICQIAGISEALVIRNSSDLFRVIGTSLLAKPLADAKAELEAPDVNDSFSDYSLVDTWTTGGLDESERLDVCLDIVKLYGMLH